MPPDPSGGFSDAAGASGKGGRKMSEQTVQDSRLAVAAIVVEDPDSVAELNGLLHQCSPYIVGRMGIPCRNRGVCLISVALDAPGEVISALTGRLGRLPGVSVKTAYSKV